MVYLFVAFTLFCLVAVTAGSSNRKELIPFYMMFVLQLVGIVLFKLSSTLFDYFLVFELVTISMYCFSARKIDNIFFMKFLSYFLVVIFTQNIDVYPVTVLIAYVIINIILLSTLKTNYTKEVRIPLFSFNLFALVSLREIYSFDYDFRWSLISVGLMLAVVIFNKFRTNRLFYIILNLTVCINLLTLNHSSEFLIFTVTLLLSYLALSFISSKISRMTYDNVVLLMLTFSLVPLMRANVLIVVLTILAFSILNYFNYSSGKYIDG
ncbi:hypothetical protein [Halobacteriovorax sp. HLS]|uniref:hypothetical protein n=1 Tax=Halobacteriovorax sp. HLS TaxID=2234000 RepID=UPI0013E2B0C2|nr:hypothetical protein [Halobacteriovorax sp. HLS]